MRCLESFKQLSKVQQLTRDTYEKWRQTLIDVGIGRPGYFRFQAQVMPKNLHLAVNS